MDIPVTLGNPDGLVDPKLYGQFIEHILTCIDGGIYDPGNPLSNEAGIRTDVVEKMKALSPPILRFPGGTVMCQYHWEDAIGPKETRIRRKNLIWGGELDPGFGTAEFICLCRELGAEPMICVNMASGTPEEAGNWVEYCNGTGNTHYANLRRSHGYPEPFNVKYWCIGNESYAQPDIGVHHDVSLYIRDAWEYIKFMKLTDRNIKTVIVGCDDDRWNKAVLDSLHPVTDFLSYHHYSAQGELGLYGPFSGERDLKTAIQKLSQLIESYPDTVTDFSPWYRFPPRNKKIQLAIDEWNIWDFQPNEHYGLFMTYNWRDALWTASILNLFIASPSVGLANLAQSVNVIAPIIAQKDGAWFQTIAYPLRLYRNEMYGTRIPCSYRSPQLNGGAAGMIDSVSICAVQDVDGIIRIAVVNRDFSNGHTLDLHFLHPRGTQICGTVTQLTAERPESVCSMTGSCVQKTVSEFTGNQISLPPGSICILSLA